MQIQLSEQQKALLSNYVENKEVADKIIGIIAENQLSRRQVEGIFCDINRLIRSVPFIPKGESLEFEIEKME